MKLQYLYLKRIQDILQSTKNGDFKGSNEYEHDADISIKIDNRKAECMKIRYQ